MHKDVSTTAPGAAHIPSIPDTPLGFLAYISQPHFVFVIGGISVEVVSAVLNQSVPFFYKFIIDGVEAGDQQIVLLSVIGLPIVVMLVQLSHRASSWLTMFWVTSGKKDTCDQLTNYALKHSHSYFTDRFAGTLTGKVSNVANSLEQLITEIVWTYVSVVASFITTFAIMYIVDVKIAGLFAALVLFLILINLRFVPKKRELSRKGAEASSKLQGHVTDIFTNNVSVRQYTASNNENETVDRLSTTYRNAQRRNWMFSDRTQIVNIVILGLFLIAVMYLLYTDWRAGLVGTGDMVLVVSLILQISFTLTWIGRAFTNWARFFGNMDEGLKEIIRPFEISDSSDAMILNVQNGKMEWQDVQFEFGENKVFKDFNLTITPGQRVGLVGPSGAGKTTFVSLLLRQHDLAGGAIMIDGQNIAEVTQDSLRQNIAVVPQEPLLFHRTIRENIAYGKPDATEAEIIEVAKKAQAHDFISELPDSYDTLVGERGVKLSGGQKQRVAIARAMLKDAPILILDEATSALDSESEVSIQKALHELMAGKTVVAIAHRLSTLREMDRIIVLESGQVVEDGNHQTLTQAGGTYQRLWEHQAGGFLQE
ncbi:MAG: ABC transporter ATP-binding protein [Patescibacteria group bacterium]